MPTRRTIRQRQPRGQRITPAAVATFNAMLVTNDATLYDELLSQLHDQLDLLPWQGPAVVDPGEECPYPKDTAAYEWWPTAQALYRLLSQAAAARCCSHKTK